MEFNLHTQAVCSNEIIFEANIEQPVDSDITLPDYCPDIQRVLKCTLTPRITGIKSTVDRITVDGSALIRIIYCCENSNVRCYEQSIPFSKNIDVNGLTDTATVSMRAKSDYANCRAVSQRRVDVHGMLTLITKVSKRRDDNIITGAEGSGIQLKCKQLETVNALGEIEKAFPMSEIIEVGESNPPIAQIIRSSSSAMIDDVKIISNKLLIKGELIADILYCADSPGCELICLTHSMPISQIIEFEGIEETSKSDVKLIVTSLEITPKSDSGGNMQLVDINARICAVISAYNTVEVPIVSDAYSTKYDMQLDHRQMDFSKLSDSFKDSFISKNTMDFSGIGIAKILDMWCGDITSAAVTKADELIISGSVTLHFLFLDKDNQPGYAEKQADYEYKRSMKEKIEKLKCEPSVIVTGCNHSLNTENRVDVRIEFTVESSIFSNNTDRIVMSIQPDEASQKERKTATLTIYFADKNEQVWNIARKYNTTVDMIMQENNLASEIINEKARLLIPTVVS